MCERFQLQKILFLWTVQQFLKYHYQKAFTWFCWHICWLYPTPAGALKWPFSWHKRTEFFRTSKTSNNKLLIFAFAFYMMWCSPAQQNTCTHKISILNTSQQNCHFAKKRRSRITSYSYLQSRKVRWLREMFPMPCIISSSSDFWFNLTIFRNSF